MWIFAPVSWPIAKLLDRLLGEDHGTTYKKAGLKTLVTLHQSLGDAENEGLNQDEVSIISGVLDLKAKAVGAIMTPINDVFTLPSDACLDEEMMDEIMREGYSRIPIHKPKNRNDFVGMLLVKMLITYDPEDHKHVNEFSLATLPETSPETSCLDIINFFQEGKSHMVLVSDFPGDDHGALGVVTLEDVIEELIGEEIIDESDVYVDIHKAIRRTALAPTHKARASKADIAADRQQLQSNDGDESENEPPKADSERQPLLQPNSESGKINPAHRASAVSLGDPKSSKAASLLLRRRSSGGSANTGTRAGPFNKFGPDLRDQLRNLGPSNAASRPKQTRVNTIRIKPGVGTIPEHPAVKEGEFVVPVNPEAQHGIGEDLMKPGFKVENGDNGNANGYGTLDGGRSYRDTDDTSNNEDKHDARSTEPTEPSAAAATLTAQVEAAAENSDLPQGFPESHTVDGDNLPELPEKMVFGRVRSHDSDGEGGSVVGSLNSGGSSPKHVTHSSHRRKPTGTTRSGSITESVVDAGGVKKLVLETAPSRGEDEDSERSTSVAVVEGNEGSSGDVTPAEEQKNGATNGASTPKSKAKKKKKKAKKNSVSN